MAPAAKVCMLLEIPTELRLIIYDYALSDFKLDYDMTLATQQWTYSPSMHMPSMFTVPVYAPWQEPYDSRRRYALPSPHGDSFESAVFFKQPLLATCQVFQQEALSLYITRLEEINYEAKSEYEQVVKTITMLGESGDIDAPDERIAFCSRELDCVLRTTMSLREAAT